MSDSFKVAAIQMVSTPEPRQNFDAASRLVAQAAQQGAQLALLPEYWPIMGLHERDKLAHAEADGSGPMQECMSALAREHRLWLVGGTLPLQSAVSGKVLNTSLVYGPDGQRVARYDKIHLFNFVRGEENYDEARTIEYGSEVRSFEAPFGRVGLSVCYDLRFPELYRAMGECALIVMPAAFTYTTGRAHWELLLRARAVENQCYVLASAQGGQHVNGRRTWGHSMLVDPWGEIVSVLPEGEGLVIGDIDPHRLQYVRESLPALRHRKL
ncbi:carbon-nitrogen hydrolase family protein [Herbaspirillum sp.]|jgi:predicted amidohydrolase|uniref:carbon-nitrogen hydrolase family protein n=1 Tax=Herbaspirillum TaxID=963 RepID=UPI0025827C76|nr:carbon-nitrogen hydrolase family protein [Herbaspirillum sp.]MCP3655508.1 carbon-nitrogen hydrolase family protein [Herbaspirillum sp.]MCP3945277.1 carbon-nitrogen hydrolase family protein [Herbaspirillum sp.]MCP4034206.1 carbon-nitrogen hydrolase family protein [Herbaspirillum sp.]MCP4034369.1 carbon-nitrogen hydrolase family protein [Herbaspirillum sp.]MCP4555251.1 carbon-nitrogen hydrolase family protein [Herbaspirillum sp.]